MRYWDASGIVNLCVRQLFSDLAQDLISEDEGVVMSWLTSVECWSAFSRLRRTHLLTTQEEQVARLLVWEYQESAVEIALTELIRNTAGRLLLTYPLRAADALQLASALAWAEGAPAGAEFVCFDRRLRDAAAGEGFTVLPSELPPEAVGREFRADDVS